MNKILQQTVYHSTKVTLYVVFASDTPRIPDRFCRLCF